MAIRIKIDPVERFTAAIVRNDLSLPEQRKEIVAFVSEGIAEGDQANARIRSLVTCQRRQGRHPRCRPFLFPDSDS